MASPVRQVQLATYNLLSPALCDPKCYFLCTKSALDEEKRLQRVCDKLAGPVADLAVIALQEVSEPWAEELGEWFASIGYMLITDFYYKKHAGYMGVAIAYPHAIYEQHDLMAFGPLEPSGGSMCKEAHYHSPRQQRQYAQSLDNGKTVEIVERPATPPPGDTWSNARSKANRMLTVRLCRRNGPASDRGFLVATYHMPCSFDRPQVMMIHGMAAMHAVQARAHAAGVPFVFMGDFNTKPSDPLYTFYTHGAYPMDVTCQPPRGEGVTNWPRTATERAAFFPLGNVTSAYAAIHDREPDYTNHSLGNFHEGDRPPPLEPFTDTLDYIFLSKHWGVEAVGPMPTAASLLESGVRSQPTEEEPSDHLMLTACASLR